MARRISSVLLLWMLLPTPGPQIEPSAVRSSTRLAAPGPASWGAPLPGPLVVRRGFDAPLVRWGPGHRGVDLATRPRAAVRAAGAGTVTWAGPVAGRGVVVIRHGALRTTYEPVRPTVSRGRRVRAGEIVGMLVSGHAGPTGPGEVLLHWGLRRGESYLDPLVLLGSAWVRLLPLRDRDGWWRAASGPQRIAITRAGRSIGSGGGPWPAAGAP